MLKLHVDNKEQSEAVVRLRWTITKSTLASLEKRGVEEPFLFLSITNRGHELKRILVPLSQGMEYVPFDRAGNHQIHAFIVWKGQFNGQRDMTRMLLMRHSQREYEYNLYYDGAFEKKRLATIVGGFMAATEIEVNVSPEFFAKEPAEWEKWWVNLWYKYPAADQCEFRRRRFPAYTVQVPAVLLWVTLLFVMRVIHAVGLTLVCMRNVQYSAIIHPFDMKLDDMARDSTNFFTMDKYGKDRRLSFLLLHPLLWATIGLGVYCLSYWHMWKYLLFIVGLILLAVVFLIILLSIKDNLVSRLRKTAKEKNTDLSGIVTKKKSASATEPKMTIRLRYLKVKYMVCRPYAKG